MKLLDAFAATVAALSLVAVLPAAHAQANAAQGYPNKPVRILLGFAPCQATDVLARAVAIELTKNLGQQFFVDNRPGAAGIIATEMAAKAEPALSTLPTAANWSPRTCRPGLSRS